jgi:hypothetical protein
VATGSFERAAAALSRERTIRGLLGSACRESCWGLVEVYNEQGRFDSGQAELADRLAREVGTLLERLDATDSR